MTRKHIWPVLVLAGLPLLGGCEWIGVACPDVGSYAVNVEVRDAVTGVPATEGAILIVQEGEYADTVQGGPGAPPVLAAAPERPGTYNVLVQKAGYQDWTRQDVRVRRGGGCDRLKSARLTANLQPMGSSQ